MSPRVEMAAGRADRDGDLVEALRRGEPEGAECLVSGHGDRAYRLAMRITRNERDAEDAVQEAFQTALGTIEAFHGESTFAAWLHRIVAAAAHRKLHGAVASRRELSLDEVLPAFDDAGQHCAPMMDWSPDLDDASAGSELQVALTSAIDALPEPHRAALVLRDVEGLSEAEVAAALSLDVAAAKRRVHRARLFVRNHVGAVMGEALEHRPS